MQKKNALGTDPLSWLKEKDKKENSEKTESNISDQEKLADKRHEPKGPDGIRVQSKEHETKATDVSNVEKAVEKSKYEHDAVSGINKEQEEEKKTYKTSDDVTGEHRRKVLGEATYSYHARTREVSQKESPATMFVIVYTVLLLILGFIVYRDLTKQIDVLNTKLTNIEKKVDASKINYKDTKVNDVW